MYTYKIFFIYSPVDKHLGCSEIIMAIENNVSLTWKFRYPFKIPISFPLELHPAVGLRDHVVVVLFLLF